MSMLNSQAARHCRSLPIWVAWLLYCTVQGSNVVSTCDTTPCIFFVNADRIGYVKAFNASDKGEVVSGLNRARALALHVQERLVYWSEYNAADTEHAKIRRLNLTSSTTQDVITDVGEVDDIAVEWESGLIYWTDYLFERIEVANIDGSYRKILIWEDVLNPRAIAVDPRTGYLFWTEWGWDHPKIERATLAGTERIILQDLTLSNLEANGLVIDYESSLLYWVDAWADEIKYVNFNASSSGTVERFTVLNARPFSLAFFNEMLYFSDLKSRSIERFNLTTGEHERNMGWFGTSWIFGIAFLDSSTQPQGMTDCKLNTNCSQLCLLTPSGAQCACSDGYELSADNVSCTAVQAPVQPPLPAIDIRLVNRSAPSELEGRVEIKLQGSDVWGTVCDDHFDLRDAKVICRMLHYQRAVRVVSAHFYYGVIQDEDAVDIFLDNLKCRGDENSLMECTHGGWNVNNCGHREDVGVVCSNESVPTPTPNATSPSVGPPPNVTVRLRGGPSSNQGRVEVYHDGRWGTICDNDFDIVDADVVCRMLGHQGAWSTYCCGWFGSTIGEIWLDSLQCSGDETSIAQCNHGGWGNHQDVCTHYNDVGVYCIPNPASRPENIVRLEEGTSASEGRVEIFHDGEWGTICDDRWDLRDATVICRMLNYSGALAAPKFSSYNAGTGKIWLDNLDCIGNESSIEDCQHGGWENHDCSHSEDASVICRTNDSALPVYDTNSSLMFAELRRGLLFQVDLHASHPRAAPLPIDSLRGATAIGFDPIDKMIYYAESWPGIIRRSYLNGSHAETIINGVYYANRLAIDYIGRNIYYTDSSRYRIDVAALDGAHRSALIYTTYPEGVALDLINGYIYWSSNGVPPRIERADMDGRNPRIIANLSSGSHPSGVTLDSNGGRLYWTDRDFGIVSYIDLQTGQQGEFISEGLYEPLDVSTHRGKLYVSDVGTGPFWDGGIYSASLRGSGSVSKVIDLLKDAWGLDAYDEESVITTGLNGCLPHETNCSHLCLISPSGSHCACPDDMELVNETTCAYRKPLILHTECFYSEIYKAPLGGDDLFSVTNSIPLEHVSCPHAIATEVRDNRIYWTDLIRKHIARSNLDGTEEEVVVQHVNYSMGLAVDSYAENIYFTDWVKRTVEVAKHDGSFRKVLFELTSHSPVGLAIDTIRGYMYYSAWGTPPLIQRAELDGSSITTLVEFPAWSEEGPSALAIDLDENVLYWVGGIDAVLQFIDLRYPQSEVVQQISFSRYLHRPFGLALDAHYFYWSDGLLGNVIRAGRNPDREIEALIQYQYSPRGVNIFNPQDEQALHPCVSECSHLCLLKPGGYQCACPDDSDVSCNTSTHVTNAYGCQEDPSLYFIDRHEIACIDLAKSNHTYVSKKTVKRTNIQEGAALDIDHREGMLYWSDTKLWTINRMSLTSGEAEVILRDLGEVESLAVEWESELVYWTDYLFETIEVAKVDGSYRKTLFDSDLYNPRGIAVDPKRGLMFWTVWGFGDPKLERADLSGENRVRLASFIYDFSFHLLAVSVLIDYHEERVYWIDGFTDNVDSMDYDGSNRKNVHFISENIYPTDLALYRDSLYWVDWASRSIHWINKTNPGSYHSFGHLSQERLQSAVVSDKSRQPVASPANRPPCRIDNGGCSQLCLLTPGGGRKCACANNAYLESDGVTCSNVTQPTQEPLLPDVMVRLAGSNNSHEGRVEVGLLVNGTRIWGTVCDDHWGLREADVVCRMLNYSGALYVVTNSHFGQLDDDTPILMDNVKCRGDEESLAGCRHNGWFSHNCFPSEGAGVVCRTGSEPEPEVPTLAPGPHPELQVRLRNGPSSNQGRVELFLNGTWGTICDNNWGIEEANVICRMLNYTEGAWTTQCCGWYYTRSAPAQIWLDNVHCVGNEESIAECLHGGWGSHDCQHTQDVGVVCKYTPVPTPDQTLRLVDGLRQGEGRVEIFHAGHWGTVCDDFWDIKDAQVVCRELGYSRALSAPQRAFFGEGNGHIWLDNLHCDGSEMSIRMCPHRGWNNENCRHYEDASVICNNGSGNIDTDDYLLTCEGVRNLCHVIPLVQGSLGEEIPLLFKPQNPQGVTYDPSENRVYWTSGVGTVERAFLNGTSHETVIKDLQNPIDIEIDHAGRNMFVADHDGGRIMVARLDGTFPTTVVHYQSPQGIALDSNKGYLYFSSFGPRPQIIRVNMDGQNLTVLVNLSSSGEAGVIDVVLDKRQNKLYFADNNIKVIDLDSLQVHSLPLGNTHVPVGLTLFNNSLYWTSWGTGSFTGAIFKAELTNGSHVQMMADGFSYLNGIFAHDSEVTEAPGGCQNNGACSQICVPTPRGDQCMCQLGMRLQENGKDCVLSDVLFVTDWYYNSVYMVPLKSASNNALVALPFQNTEDPIGVALDPFESRVYWTDNARGVVVRSDLSGRDEEVIRADVADVMGIALDLVGGNAYWINNINHTIEVAKLNGHHAKVLVIDLHSNSVDIALDTTRGFMYWSAYGIIERAELDGSNRRVVALLGGFFGHYDAQSLVVDVAQNRLYFVSRINYGIFYVDLNAGDGYVHSLLVNFYYFLHPFGIAIDDEHVYWNEYIHEAVFRTRKDDSSQIETVVSGFYDPRGMVLYRGNATRNTQHPCFQSNGGCSQLCLLKAGGGYTCACSSHPDPRNPCNETTVRPPVTPYPTRATSPTLPPSMEAQGCSSPPCIYYADKTSIRAINHALVYTTKVESSVVVSNLLNARAVDVHVQENMIYWSDIGLEAILRVNLTSGKIEPLITENLGRVEALAVEWESMVLYWTDSSSGRIEVARLDGRFRKTLIYENVFDPRAIGVDPREGQGYVYFSDMDTSVPRVERAHLDGTNRETIVYYWLYVPLINSITIDFAEDRLIWLDTQDNSIMSANLDGSGEVIHRIFYQNMAPDDVDLLGDTVFFSDVHSHSIERVNKSTAQHLLNFGWLSNNEVYGLAVFDSSRQPQGMKSCRQNNGGCSHLCLLNPYGRTCVCPNGMVANENNTNCTSLTPIPRPPVQAMEIRLMGGNRSNEGRVEIRKPDGSWGTICSDLWDIKDARVACHMLQFKDALAAVTDKRFGTGHGPVWMNNVECSGDEATLEECLSDAWRDVIFTCTSQRHAGVICKNESTNETLPQPTRPSGPLPDVRVRLQDGPTFNQGRVEVLYNNEWRGICDHSWDISDAEVVCKMLNFTGAWSTQCCGWYGGGTGTCWLDHVGCLGDEDTIAQCSHAGWGRHDSVPGSDVGVLCKYTPSPQPEGQTIRLADGLQEGEGRVEVFFNGHWGTVCDDYWDIKDADVVCRMLNYSGAISAVKFAGFGRGNGHVWLDNVQCSGTETSLEDCEHEGIGNHDCSHSEDAGVVCVTDRIPNYGATHFMMYTDAARGLILHQDLTIPHAQPAYLPVRDAIFPGYLSYDHDNEIVYWSDELIRGIFRSHLNGSSYETVKRSMDSPAGLAVETFTQTLYYTDTQRGVIEVSKLDGSFPKVILYDSSPVDISLDVSNGLLYYITNNPPQIGRVEMNGANPTILANLSSESDPIGIDLDVARQRLVWSERGVKRIGYIDLGSNQTLPQTLISGDQAPIQSLAGIALDNIFLYWIDVGTGEWSGGVFKTHKQTASLVTKVDDRLRKPVDTIIYDSTVEAVPVSRGCQTNNGGCSHLCLLHSSGVQCACPVGKHLDDARKFCSDDDILVYADSGHSQIYITSLMATDPISSNKELQVTIVDEPLAVAVDQLEGRIYWTDARGSHIVCANLDGTSEEVIVEYPNRPLRFNGIAVDVVSRTLYWTSHNTQSGEGSVHVSRLDGSYKKTLFTIHEDLQAFDIVLDPSRGYMYWSTESIWFHPHDISRADMDGTNKRAIIQLDSLYYFWGGVYGLALDSKNNVLYWVGYHDTLIQSVDLTIAGEGVLNDYIRNLYSHGNHLWTPYGLTLYKDYVYWTNQYTGIVARVNSSNGLNFEIMAEGLFEPRGIDVFHPVTQVPHPCNQNNGGCTHLCLIVPGAYKCACPDLVHNCLTTPYPTPSTSTLAMTPPITSSSRSSVGSGSSTTSSYSSSASSTSSTPVSTPSSTPVSTPSSTPVSTRSSTPVSTPSSTPVSTPSSTPVSTPSSTPQSSSSVAPTTAPTSNYCDVYNPCGENGNCAITDTGYNCTCTGSFIGQNCTEDISQFLVVIEIDIPREEFNEDDFAVFIADMLNEECTEDACSTESERARRETPTGPFKPEDIHITSVKVVDGKVQVEYAVVRTTPEGKSIPVPSQTLAEITEKGKADLGRELGGTVLSVKVKPPPVTGTPTVSGQAGGKQDSGLIVGVVVGVAIIIICVALAVWYFRLKKQNASSILDKEETDPRPRGSAFENPGYDSTGAIDASGEGSFGHFSPVHFVPFEHDKDTVGASNPLYEIGMVRLDDGEKDGTSNEYSTNEHLPSSEPKQPSANEAEELPVKVPLDEETCTGHVEITVETEPQYETPVSSKIDQPESRTDEVEVTAQQDVEPRSASLDAPSSAHGGTGQTVLVMDDVTA